MTLAEDLAEFVVKSEWADLSSDARQQLRLRILDSLGCALGAVDAEPIAALRGLLRELGGNPKCSLVGGGKTAPDRAALFNSALVRYLDFNDSYLAKGETCHPSDNLGAVMAAVEYGGGGGRELMAALAVAYQVQCRLSDVAPVRSRGFDHTTQGSYAVAAGASKGLGLDLDKTVNAIAIAGTALNALRVARTGALSHWKGLAYPHTAFGGTHAALMASRGITGPREVFEGNKGFMDSISGPFEIDWSKEDLERVNRTILKKYNAEVHSQSAIEGLMELREQHGLTGREVEAIDVEIFDVAYHIIGGGEEGDKYVVRTKEEADHSLQYILAVALLDGAVMPAQYLPERIIRKDVQGLLRKVRVRPNEEFSRRFPEAHACRVRVKLLDGRRLEVEKADYEGFHTRPMSWSRVASKFEALAFGHVDASLRKEIINKVERLEDVELEELTSLLAEVRPAEGAEGRRRGSHG